ncbi:MAG: aldehyde ferredoxin oxidoreductase C-terminal domain-containing protein [Bacteroidales bacterium]
MRRSVRKAAREELNWKDTSCFNCGIRCSKWARWDGHEIEGPEYETTTPFWVREAW